MKRKENNLILCVDVMFIVFLAQNIGNYQARFERFIKRLKMDGFEVLGYARKSPHDLSNEALKKNLQNMITCLRSRSWSNLFTSRQKVLPRARLSHEVCPIRMKN